MLHDKNCTIFDRREAFPGEYSSTSLPYIVLEQVQFLIFINIYGYHAIMSTKNTQIYELCWHKRTLHIVKNEFISSSLDCPVRERSLLGNEILFYYTLL